MPRVTDEKTITFDSAEEFLTEYEQNLLNNGLFATSDVEIPMREKRTFSIKIQGQEAALSLLAEVVFAAGGQLGFQVHFEPVTKAALEMVVKQFKSSLLAPDAKTQQEAPEPPAEPAPSEAEAQAPPAQQPPIRQAIATPPPQAAPQFPEGATPTAGFPSSVTPAPQSVPTSSVGGAPSLSIHGSATGGKKSGEFDDITPVELNQANIKTIPLIRLVATVSTCQLPVTLKLTLGEGDIASLDFNVKGNMVGFSREGSALDLLDRLEKDNRLERKRKEKVIEALGDKLSDRGIITFLVERRQIRVQDYWMTLRAQATDTLNEARRLKACPFHLHTAVITRRTGVPFGMLVVPWMDIALRDMGSDEMEELLSHYWHSFPMLNTDSCWPVHTLGLDPQTQTFFEESLNGCVNLDHVRKTSPMGIHRTKRLFLTMMAMGLIQLSEDPAAEAKVLSPEQQLLEDLERRQKMTRFDQLEVHWSDHPGAYAKALERIKREYGPESKWHHFHPETIPICQKIIRLAEDAKIFLTDRDRRVTHRNEQITKFQQQVSANLMFKQAELMGLRQEYQQARIALQVALEMDPRKEYQELLKHI